MEKGRPQREAEKSKDWPEGKMKAKDSNPLARGDLTAEWEPQDEKKKAKYLGSQVTKEEQPREGLRIGA